MAKRPLRRPAPTLRIKLNEFAAMCDFYRAILEHIEANREHYGNLVGNLAARALDADAIHAAPADVIKPSTRQASTELIHDLGTPPEGR
jgi:hypothetical protein